jgi:ABC-type phosphate transport system permease subunit
LKTASLPGSTLFLNLCKEAASRKVYRLSAGRIFLFFIPLLAGSGSIVIGILSLSSNSLEHLALPFLVLIGLSLLFILVYEIIKEKKLEWKLLLLVGLAAVSSVVVLFLPGYFYGLELDAIIHRSLVSAFLILAVSIPAFSYFLYRLFGPGPRASDLAHYPVIVIPVLLGLAAFSILIWRLVEYGLPDLNWQMLSTPFIWESWKVVHWENDWPVWATEYLHQTGILNYILGTLLLMFMTSLISLPIGIAVGIYVTEYAGGFWSNLIKLPCHVLRSTSVFILGLIALAIVSFSKGNFLSDIFAGFYFGMDGTKHTASGSFVTAAVIISLLVTPLIARATEEGILSTPQEIKEGSLSLGTSRLHTLFNITIPWSIPNIITALLLGCAEAAGSLATIWFIADVGEYGISPLGPVTSLSYFIYYCREGVDMSFIQQEGSYQFSAALILIIITIGLSITAIILKRKFSKRYRGT